MTNSSPFKILVRHKAGSKANQVEEFPTSGRDTLSIGRDVRCDISFDQTKDDSVSRRHAEILIDHTDGIGLQIKDLGSSNGTLVNGQLVRGTQELLPEDIVQLGKSGPKFLIDVNPRPASLQTRTRVISGVDTQATRIVDIATAASTAAFTSPEVRETASTTVSAPTAMKTGVGKDTVQMMLTSERKSSNRFWIGAIAGLVLFSGAGIGFMYWRQQLDVGALKLAQAQEIDRLRSEAANAQVASSTQVRQQLGQSAQEIAQKFSNSTAQIEFNWRVFDSDTGRPIFHRIVRCANNTTALAFVRLKDGSVVRWLTLDDDDRRNLAVSRAGSGSGFVVSENGFLLTNKHVASGWSYENNLAGFGAGVVFDVNNSNAGACRGAKVFKLDDRSQAATSINDWVPESGALLFEADATRPLLGVRRLVGRNEKLEVRFAGSNLGVAATLVRSSNESDVALLKIDSPQTLVKFDLASDDQITTGERVTVIGYPGVSSRTVSVRTVNEGGTARTDSQVVPQPTVTEGIVSLVMPRQQLTGDTRIISRYGETFQTSINATGSGNSGGPILNANGKVIGLFTYTLSDGRVTTSAGVPIRFGRDLFQTQRP